jgi:hypothetical protein
MLARNNFSIFQKRDSVVFFPTFNRIRLINRTASCFMAAYRNDDLIVRSNNLDRHALQDPTGEIDALIWDLPGGSLAENS